MTVTQTANGEPIVVVAAKQKNPGCTVVAHLSDLHLRATSVLGNEPWLQLRQDLYEHRDQIDVIAVTGDLIEGAIRDWIFWRIGRAFNTASAFLNSLCEAAEISAEALIAIPGNHDARIKGFLPISRLRAFRALFGDAARPRWFEGLNLFAYGFDSNESAWFGELAAGSVPRNAFTELQNAVAAAQKQAQSAWRGCHRVALLHHHPMPIAATERRGLRSMEEFLLLRNAGTFMTELLRADIDLVLHGHKHYPSFSKATYIDDDASAKSVTVVACGSSGAAGPHPTYNLLTLYDDGRIDLERRIQAGATYPIKGDTIPLRSYAEAREFRYRRLAEQEHLLNVGTYSAVTIIDAHSGDARGHETYSEVTSADSNVRVREVPVTFSSASGYFEAPMHEPSSIGWRWDEVTRPKSRRGFSIFEPPIADQPVTFTRISRTANAFHFSKKEREDTTGRKDATENLRFHIPHAVERFAMSAVFPSANHFPREIGLRVTNRALRDHNDEPLRDDQEEQHCRQGFHILKPSNTIVLNVLNPLLGYEYSFVWTLLDHDPAEPVLSEAENGMAGEAESRLTRHASDAAFLKVLHRLIDQIRGLLPHPAGDDSVDLEAALFAYSEKQRGLAVICANVADRDDPILTSVILPGRDIVGQAWRRRAALLYTPGKKDVSIYRDDGRPARTAILAIPLMYPVKGGRRIAIVSLASRSKLSPLLQLADDVQSLSRVVTHVALWWQTDVSAALGLKTFQPAIGARSANI